jgi:hypothetical protein
MSCNVRLNRQTFYQNHRDELKEKCKIYYRNNIQKFKDYYQDNKEKIKEYGREHSKEYYHRHHSIQMRVYQYGRHRDREQLEPILIAQQF